MAAEKDNYERFVAMLRKHRDTIELVGRVFYPTGDYNYLELVCDLTTFLWAVCNEMPTNAVIFNEKAWVYSLLYRKASNLVRNESRRQRHFEYEADLSEMVCDSGEDPRVRRMYRLIDRLALEDREIVLMYIDKVPVNRIALTKGKSPWAVYRIIEKAVNELRRLDAELDDDDDDIMNYSEESTNYEKDES